ncbi:envelope stress response membrane protein PspB [Vibrio gallicus]|uniref:envelope stress response membrane protein PspB n=1 Tax=Vibrio gallicus TaxID=190897 RepID=UPI0021C3E81A|nr:envelope stress response membrane protein PspB [Vibrio gallicus]
MSTALIAIPLAIFLIFVAPLWLILHYRSQRKLDRGLTDQQREQLQQLSTQAIQMKQRIDILESLLDAQTPEWRNKS